MASNPRAVTSFYNRCAPRWLRAILEVFEIKGALASATCTAVLSFLLTAYGLSHQSDSLIITWAIEVGSDVGFPLLLLSVANFLLFLVAAIKTLQGAHSGSGGIKKATRFTFQKSLDALGLAIGMMIGASVALACFGYKGAIVTAAIMITGMAGEFIVIAGMIRPWLKPGAARAKGAFAMFMAVGMCAITYYVGYHAAERKEDRQKCRYFQVGSEPRAKVIDRGEFLDESSIKRRNCIDLEK